MFSVALWLKILLSFILLDFSIYLQHRLFHYTPLLWRLHRMHHTDLDLDVTSGNRFHPLEIAVSLLIKMAAVLVLGAPGAARRVAEHLIRSWEDRPLAPLALRPPKPSLHDRAEPGHGV